MEDFILLKIQAVGWASAHRLKLGKEAIFEKDPKKTLVTIYLTQSHRVIVADGRPTGKP
jgi:hypothetical protein